MPLERRRTLRVVLSLLVLLGGVLLALKMGDHGARDDGVTETSATLFSEPQSTVAIRPSTTQPDCDNFGSTEHESRCCCELIADQFAGVKTQTDFRPGLKVEPEWDTVSARLL